VTGRRKFSYSKVLLRMADRDAGMNTGLGANGSSQKADVGLALYSYTEKSFRSLTTLRCVSVVT